MNRRSFMVALAAAATPAAALAGRVVDALASNVWFEARMKDEDDDVSCTTSWHYDTSAKQWVAKASCKNKNKSKSRSATVEGILHIEGSSNKTCETTQSIAKKSTKEFNCHVNY